VHRLRIIAVPLALTALACTDDVLGEAETVAATDATTDATGMETSDDEVGTTVGTSSDTSGSTESSDGTTTQGESSESTESDGAEDSDSDSEGGSDTTGGGDTVVRFIAMGDGGEGNDSQYAVAAAIEQVCADRGGCDFVVYLGDNFYDDGVESAMDDQFQTKFEQPYADLDLPFYPVLGNHDYGLLSFAWYKGEYEVEYSEYSDKWTMPAEYYSVSYPNIDLFMLNTTRFMWGSQISDQQDWIDDQIAASDAPWKVAMGHHPYYSNGEHGNAGNYEGFPWPPQLSGDDVEEVIEESLCGQVDLYLCGHDHNRQWVTPTCGPAQNPTHFIVSGAAAKTTDFAYHSGGNDVYWENDVTPGFLIVEVTADTMHTEFFDENGTMEFERDITK